MSTTPAFTDDGRLVTYLEPVWGPDGEEETEEHTYEPRRNADGTPVVFAWGEPAQRWTLTARAIPTPLVENPRDEQEAYDRAAELIVKGFCPVKIHDAENPDNIVHLNKVDLDR
jgi:hypothetical protein